MFRSFTITLVLSMSLFLTGGVAHAGKKVMPPAGSIQVNTDSETALMDIPGIGQVRAAAIITERAKGPYKDCNDLIVRVKGVGSSAAKEGGICSALSFDAP